MNLSKNDEMWWHAPGVAVSMQRRYYPEYSVTIWVAPPEKMTMRCSITRCSDYDGKPRFVINVQNKDTMTILADAFEKIRQWPENRYELAW